MSAETINSQYNQSPLFSVVNIFYALENYVGWSKNFFSNLLFIIVAPFLWLTLLIFSLWGTYKLGKFKKEVEANPILDEKDYDKLKKIYTLLSRSLGGRRTHPFNQLPIHLKVLLLPLTLFIRQIEKTHFVLSKRLCLIPPNATLEQVEQAAKLNEESGLKSRLDDDDDFYAKAIALGKIKCME